MSNDIFEQDAHPQPGRDRCDDVCGVNGNQGLKRTGVAKNTGGASLLIDTRHWNSPLTATHLIVTGQNGTQTTIDLTTLVSSPITEGVLVRVNDLPVTISEGDTAKLLFDEGGKTVASELLVSP